MTEELVKLDITATWRRTVALLRDNWALFSAIAGPLVFLPIVAAFLRLASSDVNWSSQNAVLVEQQLNRAVSSDWWIYLLLYIGLLMGQMTLFVLVLHKERPTVGQAIVSAATILPSFLVTWLAVQMVTELPRQLLLAVSPSLAWTSIIFTLIGLFLTVRLYVLSPVFALGDSLNPIVNVKRTWAMTSRNGWAIFGLSLLVGISSMVAGLLVWIFLSLVFALILPVSAAPTIMLTLLAIVLMLFILLFVALTIAIYQELAQPA